MTASPAFCAVDFGTSNSAVVVAGPAMPGRLVALEGERTTMPSAVFHDSEDGSRRYGRAAVAAYVDGHEGRLMRSLKSILGSSLVDETTQLGDGLAVRYLDVIAGFLRQLRQSAERDAGTPIARAVFGRPVYFVDDDAAADARAERALGEAARAAGFVDVSFQFEPIAAALDYERRLTGERLVLVADIGGGTSDFTVIRLGGPRRASRASDVLASHGVHVAGTDFDQRVALDAIMPSLGFGALTPEGREVPNAVYHDLATWHLINGIYAPRRRAELQAMSWFYADRTFHRRLLRVVDARLGHRLLGRAEDAKIDLSVVGETAIDLTAVDDGLTSRFDANALARSLARPLAAIVAAARETVRRAGVGDADIGALYFTGGSTGLALLTDRLRAAYPHAEAVFGDPDASVARGLGLEAVARYA